MKQISGIIGCNLPLVRNFLSVRVVVTFFSLPEQKTIKCPQCNGPYATAGSIDGLIIICCQRCRYMDFEKEEPMRSENSNKDSKPKRPKLIK